MFDELQTRLAALVATQARVTPSSFPPDRGEAPIEVLFSDGTILRAHYWRTVKDDRSGFSSFDHGHRYGFPALVDAVADLAANVEGRSVVGVTHDPRTGDLQIDFTGRFELQVLNVTGYEIWEITFPDGYGEYSNYAK